MNIEDSSQRHTQTKQSADTRGTSNEYNLLAPVDSISKFEQPSMVDNADSEMLNLQSMSGSDENSDSGGKLQQKEPSINSSSKEIKNDDENSPLDEGDLSRELAVTYNGNKDANIEINEESFPEFQSFVTSKPKDEEEKIVQAEENEGKLGEKPDSTTVTKEKTATEGDSCAEGQDNLKGSQQVQKIESTTATSKSHILNPIPDEEFIPSYIIQDPIYKQLVHGGSIIPIYENMPLSPEMMQLINDVQQKETYKIVLEAFQNSKAIPVNAFNQDSAASNQQFSSLMNEQKIGYPTGNFPTNQHVIDQDHQLPSLKQIGALPDEKFLQGTPGFIQKEIIPTQMRPYSQAVDSTYTGGFQQNTAHMNRYHEGPGSYNRPRGSRYGRGGYGPRGYNNRFSNYDRRSNYSTYAPKYPNEEGYDNFYNRQGEYFDDREDEYKSANRNRGDFQGNQYKKFDQPGRSFDAQRESPEKNKMNDKDNQLQLTIDQSVMTAVQEISTIHEKENPYIPPEMGELMRLIKKAREICQYGQNCRNRDQKYQACRKPHPFMLCRTPIDCLRGPRSKCNGAHLYSLIKFLVENRQIEVASLLKKQGEIQICPFELLDYQVVVDALSEKQLDFKKKVEELKRNRFDSGGAGNADNRLQEEIAATRMRIQQIDIIKDVYIRSISSVMLRNLYKFKDKYQEIFHDLIIEKNCAINSLPIYTKKLEIMNFLGATNKTDSFMVLIGETGCGKSTQLPIYIFQYLRYREHLGRAIIVQPRKIAAISLATRVAQELRSETGKYVGYVIGEKPEEQKISQDTRIIFMTETQFIKTLLENPGLNGFSYLVIDEAHERSINCDIILAYLKKHSRPDLKVIVTSASIQFKKFGNYLKTTREVEVIGRQYPITICNSPINVSNNQYLYEVKNLITKLLKYKQQALKDPERFYKTNPEVERDISVYTGHMLVFLPSVEDLETLKQQLTELKKNSQNMHKFFVLKFHAKTQMTNVEKAFSSWPPPNQATKIILATRVAETSLTFGDLSIVIDVGYEHETIYNPDFNTYETKLVPISKSCAKQRAGRAGRTRPGICFRLYSQETFERFNQSRTPELLKLDLELTLLTVNRLNLGDLRKVDLLDKAPLSSIDYAESNLIDYKAMTKKGELTSIGIKMQKLPIEPFSSRPLFEALGLDVFDDLAIIVSMVKFSASLYDFNISRGVDRSTAKRLWEQYSKATGPGEEYEGAYGDHFLYLFIFKEFLKLYHKAQKDEESKDQSRTIEEKQPNEAVKTEDPAKKWCVDNKLNYNTLRRAYELYKELKSLFENDEELLECTAQKRKDETRVNTILRSLFQTHTRNVCVWSGDPALGYVLLGKNNNLDNIYIHESSLFFGRESETSWVMFSDIQCGITRIAQSVTSVNETKFRSWSSLELLQGRLKETKDLLKTQSFTMIKSKNCGTAVLRVFNEKMTQLSSYCTTQRILYKADAALGMLYGWFPKSNETAKPFVLNMLIQAKNEQEKEIYELRIKENTSVALSRGCSISEIMIDDETISLTASDIPGGVTEEDIKREIDREYGGDSSQVRLVLNNFDKTAGNFALIVCRNKEIAQQILKSGLVVNDRVLKVEPKASQNSESRNISCKVFWYSGIPTGEAVLSFSDFKEAKKATNILSCFKVDGWKLKATINNNDIEVKGFPSHFDEVELQNWLYENCEEIKPQNITVVREDYEFYKHETLERDQILGFLEKMRARHNGSEILMNPNKTQKMSCRISFKSYSSLKSFMEEVDRKQIKIYTEKEEISTISLHVKPLLEAGEIRLYKERYRVFAKEIQEAARKTNEKYEGTLKVELPSAEWESIKAITFLKIKIKPCMPLKDLVSVAQKSLEVKKMFKDMIKGQQLKLLADHELASLVYSRAFSQELEKIARAHGVFISTKSSNKTITAFGKKENVSKCERALIKNLDEKMEDMKKLEFTPSECDLSSFFTHGIGALQRACPNVLINTSLKKGDFVIELIGPGDELEAAEDEIEKMLEDEGEGNPELRCCVCNTSSVVNPYHMHCGHRYCFNCAKHYLLALCKRREVDWRCFKEGCESKLIVRDILAVAPEEDLVDYLRNGLLKNKFEQKDSKYAECICGLIVLRSTIKVQNDVIQCSHLV